MGPKTFGPYYQDGLVTLYHADAREILPGMEAESVDLVLTDPPYGHRNNDGDLAHNREAALGRVRKGAARAGDARPIANDGPEADELVRWMFGDANRLLVAGACLCCCCSGGGPDPQFARWSLMLDQAIGFKQAIVWDKGGLGMGWHYRRNYEMVLVGQKPGAAGKWYGGHDVGNVIRINGIKPRSHDHPTPKPVELMARFVSWHTRPGELVLDPFCGGGSTLLAAKQLGRRSIGVEIDERWCELAAMRLSQATFTEPPLPPEQTIWQEQEEA